MKIAVACLVLASASALAEEAKPAAAEEPSAAEKELMEKYVKAATPGPEHQQLVKMVGKWKLQATAWMAPGAPPMKSEATAEFKTILGGRYLEEEVHGAMGGQPFEGHGFQGFDNVTRTRFGFWMDGMTTGPTLLKGKCAAAAKTCTMKGKVSDALAGKEVPVSSTTTIKDDNNFTFEMTGPGPDGKQFKTLEIVYTRQP
jgi:hypothetical protein